MSALQAVFQTYGLPIALYTDRAGWAFYTPSAGGKVDLSRPTQLGRALTRLGIEHIPSYSPQGRGRGERLNRTLQGRLINELRVAGITTVEAANAYLREHFIADYDAQFTCPPADPDPAFVALGTVDLDSHPVPGGRAHRRPRQCRRPRGRPLATQPSSPAGAPARACA